MSGKSILKNVRQSQLKRLLLPLVFVAVMLFLFLWLPILPALRPVEIDETTPLSASVNEDGSISATFSQDLLTRLGNEQALFTVINAPAN